MTLFLIGYMGSGKSVVGKTLAEILNFQFVDLDSFIEANENATINSIFENSGEVYFRKAEHKYLNEIIQLEDTVISLGGGTPCYGNNMQNLIEAENTACIYLKTSIPVLVDRLFEERHKRPLIFHIESKEALSEFIGKHLFERASFYEQSKVIVQTDNKSVRDISESIVLQLF